MCAVLKIPLAVVFVDLTRQDWREEKTVKRLCAIVQPSYHSHQKFARDLICDGGNGDREERIYYPDI